MRATRTSDATNQSFDPNHSQWRSSPYSWRCSVRSRREKSFLALHRRGPRPELTRNARGSTYARTPATNSTFLSQQPGLALTGVTAIQLPLAPTITYDRLAVAIRL